MTNEDLKELIQDDIIAALDGLPEEVITHACQVVVDRFNAVKPQPRHVYHNEHGYSPDALHIIDEASKFCEALMKEHPEFNLIEVTGLIHGGVAEAQCSVSLQRRMGWPSPYSGDMG
jgi:hypothetical protein